MNREVRFGMGHYSHNAGTLQHQALLKSIVSHYEHDPRVLAISVFGSITRGNWDRFSDLDLDVVIADDVRLNVLEELHHLCDSLVSLNQYSALVVADGNDAGDVVFGSLTRFSIRYHTLATTNPKIVDSLHVLAGKIDQELIVRAGLANQHAEPETLKPLLDRCVYYLAVADVALQRQQLWSAIELLHRIRGLLMELYALARGGGRSIDVFQSEATPDLHARLGRTLPQYGLASTQFALEACLEIIEQDLEHLTHGQMQLADVHLQILAQVRASQTLLKQGRLR